MEPTCAKDRRGAGKAPWATVRLQREQEKYMMGFETSRGCKGQSIRPIERIISGVLIRSYSAILLVSVVCVRADASRDQPAGYFSSPLAVGRVWSGRPEPNTPTID
jgi:hypothetical protein